MKRTTLLSLMVGIAMLQGATFLNAQNKDYPSQPISLVVAFPAGSGTDSAARIMAADLSKGLGQQVIVENKPGANGTIGANYVARAKPDGYTLLVTSNTPMSIAPWMMKSIPYDPIKDFTPIARSGTLPSVLVINPSLPFKTVQELVAYAREKPGKLTYASGNGTGIVAGATFARRADIQLLHVPYKGTPQALTDLVGGQSDILFSDLTAAMPFMQSNRVRAIAVSTSGRSKIVPDLPSMQEAGVQDFDISAWNGFFGPAGMPDDIVQRLNEAINTVVETPKVQKQLADLGFDAVSGTSKEFSDFTEKQLGLWKSLIKDADLAPQ